MVALFRYLRSLKQCATHCFNANQVTQQQYEWLSKAVQEEQEAWAALPPWLRRTINRKLEGQQ